MKRAIMSIAVTAALVGGLSGAADAGTVVPIPTEWGGGTAVVDLPDFAYPASDGCYQTFGTLSLPGNNPLGWDYFTADLTVTDSIGRITDSFYEFEDGYTTSISLPSQLCTLFDAPGTYTLNGSIVLNDFPYEYTLLVSDTFTITGYAAPVVAPPVPSVSQKCKKAKAALAKAKKQNKPFKAVLAAKKKVKRVC
jgi:hypothetical protein